MWTLTSCELIRDGGSYATTLTDGVRDISLWLQIERDVQGASRHGGLFFARGRAAAPAYPDTRRLRDVEERAWLDAIREAAMEGVDARTRARVAELIQVLSARAA